MTGSPAVRPLPWLWVDGTPVCGPVKHVVSAAQVVDCRSATTLQVRVSKIDQCHGEEDRSLSHNGRWDTHRGIFQQLMALEDTYVRECLYSNGELLRRKGQSRQVVPGRFLVVALGVV